MKTIALAAAVLAASASTAAFAQPGKGACREDAKKYCGRAARGPESFRCLEEHSSSLSDGCKARLAEMRAEGDAFRADCKAEIGSSCLNLQGRALVECLESQGPKLSKACADRIDAMKKARRGARERLPAACVSEARKDCGQAAAGGVAECLRAKKDLSKECREALK